MKIMNTSKDQQDPSDDEFKMLRLREVIAADLGQADMET